MLKDFTSKVDGNNRLLDRQNRASLIAIIAYACNKEIKLDSWIVDYFTRNDTYFNDQTENFQYMKLDLEEFLKVSDVA